MSSTVPPPQSFPFLLSGGLSGFRRRQGHESVTVSPLIQPKAATFQQGGAAHRAGAGATQRLAVRTHGQQPSVCLCDNNFHILITNSLKYQLLGSDFQSFVDYFFITYSSQGWFPADYVVPIEDFSIAVATR